MFVYVSVPSVAAVFAAVGILPVHGVPAAADLLAVAVGQLF